MAKNKEDREADQVLRLLRSLARQKGSQIRSLWDEHWVQQASPSFPPYSCSSSVSRAPFRLFPKITFSGQPWTILSEDEGSLPPGHRMDVTKVFNECFSPLSPEAHRHKSKRPNSSGMAAGNAMLYEMFPICFQPNYLLRFKGQTCFL